jgi:pyruvate kinase
MKLPPHKTRIVATLGPATQSRQVMRRLLKAGMSVARVNLSHGDPASWRAMVGNLRKAARQEGRPVGLLMDLPGPKIRIGRLTAPFVTLRRDQSLTLRVGGRAGNDTVVYTTCRPLIQALKPGDLLYLADGVIQLQVVQADTREARCRVVVGGELRPGKGISAPGVKFRLPAVTTRDRRLLKLAMEIGADMVSVSFVRAAADVGQVRRALRAAGNDALVIAKIERREAVDSLAEILAASDGLMVARGDLGVETPIAGVPVLQKRLITAANQAGKPVITATQMLDSMVDSPRPTRAEVADIANAILDGSDAVMLSDETAVGSYPEDAVRMMAAVAAETEAAASPEPRQRQLADVLGGSVTEAISLSVAQAAEVLRARAIVAPTRSGYTARSIARQRPNPWIFAFTCSQQVANGLMLSRGVWPICGDADGSDTDRLFSTLRQARLLQRGDTVILTWGRVVGQSGETFAMKVETV